MRLHEGEVLIHSHVIPLDWWLSAAGNFVYFIPASFGTERTEHKVLQCMKSASKISVFCILLHFIIERQVDLRHLVVLQLLGFLQLRCTNNWP